MLRIAWIQEGAVKKMKRLAPVCRWSMHKNSEPDNQMVPVVNASVIAQIQMRFQNSTSSHNDIDTTVIFTS